jgi:hypothetical protein
MMRSQLTLYTFLILVPLAGLRAAEPAKPNIVVFLADDMGWGDSATYGHKLIQTPNLDKLTPNRSPISRCVSPSASSLRICLSIDRGLRTATFAADLGRVRCCELHQIG